MKLIETDAGLPNTCAKCGKVVKGKKWFAETVDHARAGIGYCPTCAKALQKGAEETNSLETQTKNDKES